jgi:hypothetical protein
MAGNRPPIPANIKREVRQRCGFGCVICGLPLYEYEHIEGYARVQRHVAGEITLLCDRHHREKTAGLLPAEQVTRADSAPFNRRTGASTSYSLNYSGPVCSATIGSNQMTAATNSDFVAVMVDDQPLVGFRFEDEHYLLNISLFDATNELVLSISDNELVYSVDPWDVELVGTRLIVRVASRNIFIDIRFEPPSGIHLERGRMLFNGVELLIHPEYLLVVNNAGLLQRCGFGNCVVALNVGRNSRPLPSGIRMPRVPRYEIDRAAAISWAREQIESSGGDPGGLT